MPLEATLIQQAERPGLRPAAWRDALVRLGLAWATLVVLAWAAWAEMADQWWNTSTYNHILLVPPIVLWLVRQRWHELNRLAPDGWWLGLPLLAGAMATWLAGNAAEVNLVSQVGAVAMLQASLAALLGPRVTAGLLFPLGYMLFLVPFGDELIPALQGITAEIAVALTQASGVPATIDGVFIDTPVGLFEVAEACSGVKFLVAMAALATLVAHLCFARWMRRAAFMLAAMTVPVVANGVRAWGTIFVAQSHGVAFAAGFDHLVYGWIFFAVVMTAVLGLAWRHFDRSPDDPLLDPAQIEASPRLAWLARRRVNGWQALAAVFGLVAIGAWMDRLVIVP